MSIELILIAGSTISSIFAYATAWGMLKAKLEGMAERVKAIESRLFSDHYVTMSNFQVTVEQLREDQSELRRDVKQILELLSSR